MKHLLSASLLTALCAVVFAFVSPVMADNDDLDFALVNKTGYGLKAVTVAPSGTTDWSQNLITKPLENGDKLSITFDSKIKAEKWDIRIEWVDDDAPVVWKNCKLTEITTITLHYNRDSGESTATTE